MVRAPGLWAGALAVAVALAILLGGCGARPGPAPVYVAGEPAPVGFYRIRVGDTLSDIAVREGVDLATLAGWNDLEPPYRILAGGLLRMAPPPAPIPVAVSPAAGERPAPQRALASVASVFSGGAREAPAQPRSAQPKPAARRAPAEAAGTRVDPVVGSPVDSGIDWQWPIDGRVVKTFDARDRTRQGIRIAARPGQIVVAAASGTVGYTGDGPKGYGNLIIIKHKNSYLSAYAFNRRLLAANGEKVVRGQPIAEVGQTTGGETQLHFEVRKEGAAVDPLKFLPRAR